MNAIILAVAKAFNRTTLFVSILVMLWCLAPSQLLANQRLIVILEDGRTLQADAPVLMERTNPGYVPTRYGVTDQIKFWRSTTKLGVTTMEEKVLRWSDVDRIDYYPVDGGTNCATVMRLRDGTTVGVKFQLIFDASDKEIIGQLPSAAGAMSAKWRAEYKDFTAPQGDHYIRGMVKDKTFIVWNPLQCAYIEDADKHLRIKTITFD